MSTHDSDNQDANATTTVGILGWDIKYSHLALRGVVFPRADGKG